MTEATGTSPLIGVVKFSGFAEALNDPISRLSTVTGVPSMVVPAGTKLSGTLIVMVSVVVDRR